MSTRIPLVGLDRALARPSTGHADPVRVILTLILLLIFLVFFILYGSVRLCEIVALERFSDGSVVGNSAQDALIDRLTRLFSTKSGQKTGVDVIVKVLGVVELGRAGGTFSSCLMGGGCRLFARQTWALLAAVGWRLLNPVHGSKVTLEHIGAVEALFGSFTAVGTEAADHGALVVGQGVSVLVVFASETFLVVLARHDRTLFRALGLVCEEMSFEILEEPTTIRVCASPSLCSIGVRSNRRPGAVVGID